ncbi:MAG: hypothetical protein ACRDB0_04985 [Paraclostridium sp.]
MFLFLMALIMLPVIFSLAITFGGYAVLVVILVHVSVKIVKSIFSIISKPRRAHNWK